MNEGQYRFAWVHDPEGNTIELWEPKEKTRSGSRMEEQREGTPLRHPLA